jgi:hypothetical protein
MSRTLGPFEPWSVPGRLRYLRGFRDLAAGSMAGAHHPEAQGRRYQH